MKAAIYCRVSTEDQEREGTSLQSQLEACKKLAIDKGYEVEENYMIQEVYSGLTIDRPDLTKLRGWIGTGEITAVAIYSSDRFSRDGYDFLTLIRDCERANVELLCVTEPIEHGQVGELLSYIRGWASKLEAEKIKERTMRGIRERVKGGRLPGGGKARLFGYTYLPGKGLSEGVRYVNEEEARWVREIYRWFVEEALTLNGIVYRLRSLGISSPSGNSHWSKSAIHKILTRVAYTGKTYAFTQRRVKTQTHRKAVRKHEATRVVARPPEEWIEIPNATPPIITEALFNQARKRLERNKQLASRNTKEKYLLSGYLFCSQCGRRYFGASSATIRHGVEYRYRYYRCPKNSKIVSPDICVNQAWQADQVETIVWRKMEELLKTPDLVLAAFETKKDGKEDIDSYEAEEQRLNVQLKHAEQRKDRAWKAFELTGDENKFKGEIARISADIDGLKRRKLELERRIETSQQAEYNFEGIREYCELVSRNLSGFTYDDKRLALEALAVKIRLDNENISIEGAIPEVDSSIASTTAW